jgi:cytidylate kinase
MMTIAIDGPAASGKGTLARRLAAHYGLRYLDTGLTYRAVAAAVMDGGHALDDPRRAGEAAGAVSFDGLDRDRLAADDIGEAASRIAVIPGVRAALARKQREFALAPPGAVLDGRDIGTVVLPDATVKLYVTAAHETRARRRTDELAARGEPADYAAVLADLGRRDRRDAGRAVAPLAMAADAHLLDTTDKDIEAAFRAAVAIVERARASRS